jgi:uncharacterized protein YjbJ (UPF0337 family)
LQIKAGLRKTSIFFSWAFTTPGVVAAGFITFSASLNSGSISRLFGTPGTLDGYPGDQHGEREMDKDRIEGSATQAKGKVKEWTGKLTGDSKTEAEGKADQAKGKFQNAVGGLKDAVRGK